MLQSQNYLFLAPAPPLSLISALAPDPAMYCHLKLYYNSSSTIRNMSQWRFCFILAQSKQTKVNTGTYKKDNFGSAAPGLK